MKTWKSGFTLTRMITMGVLTASLFGLTACDTPDPKDDAQSTVVAAYRFALAQDLSDFCSSFTKDFPQKCDEELMTAFTTALGNIQGQQIQLSSELLKMDEFPVTECNPSLNPETYIGGCRISLTRVDVKSGSDIVKSANVKCWYLGSYDGVDVWSTDASFCGVESVY